MVFDPAQLQFWSNLQFSVGKTLQRYFATFRSCQNERWHWMEPFWFPLQHHMTWSNLPGAEIQWQHDWLQCPRWLRGTPLQFGKLQWLFHCRADQAHHPHRCAMNWTIHRIAETHLCTWPPLGFHASYSRTWVCFGAFQWNPWCPCHVPQNNQNSQTPFHDLFDSHVLFEPRSPAMT